MYTSLIKSCKLRLLWNVRSKCEFTDVLQKALIEKTNSRKWGMFLLTAPMTLKTALTVVFFFFFLSIRHIDLFWPVVFSCPSIRHVWQKHVHWALCASFSTRLCHTCHVYTVCTLPSVVSPCTVKRDSVAHQEHAHWKHIQGNTHILVCSTFPYIEDNSSEREYAWSVWLLSLYMSGGVGGGGSCVWLALHGFVVRLLEAGIARCLMPVRNKSKHIKFVMLWCASQAKHVVEIGGKSCSATCGAETRRSIVCEPCYMYNTKGWDSRPGDGQPLRSSLSVWLLSTSFIGTVDFYLCTCFIDFHLG